jgi:predicted TIM-barrel fold metal-dependent hydrolase
MKISIYVLLQCLLVILNFSGNNLFAQRSLTIEEYDPTSTLLVKETVITRAKFPFIDVHNHQPDMPTQNLSDLISDMDKLNMTVMINLSGRGFNIKKSNDGIILGMKAPSHLVESIANVKKNAPGRFLIFTNIDFEKFDSVGWIERTLSQLEQDVGKGAVGLKIYKDLGLDLKDSNGNRIPINHPQLNLIWQKCGELSIPILIHSGEPKSFFLPHDKFNERWLELKEVPTRARPADRYPTWEQVMSEQHDIFKNNPKTTFIMAHLGWMGNDLNSLTKLLKDNPNVYTEIGAIIYELGRQPRAAKEFFITNQDRVLFGKDTWNVEEYKTIFRVLETDDEYFPYYRKRHAFWRLYGLGLPDVVLRKLYYKNALKLFPQTDKSLFPDE